MKSTATCSQCFGGNNTSGPVDVATAVNAKGGAGRMDFESETFVRGPLMNNGKAAGSATQQDAEQNMLVVHTLRGEGLDASEDGTGRGTPIVPVAFQERGRKDGRSLDCQEDLAYSLTAPNGGGRRQELNVAVPILEAGARTGKSTDDPRCGVGVGEDGDPMFTLQSGHQHAVAFSSKDHGGDATEDLSPTLRAMPHTDSHPNSGGQVAVAFESRFARNGRGAPSEIVPPLKAQSGQTGKGDAAPLLATTMAVRRLTPRECERLQGFPAVVEFMECQSMTRDEVAALLFASGDIYAIPETGQVFRRRGPGGMILATPLECVGSLVSGYRTAHLSANGIKRQIGFNRLIWISVHGIPKPGFVVDHINNIKTDNRISNLQLLTRKQNSRKAADDGLYKDSPTQVLDAELRLRLFREYKAGSGSYSELAARYGVTKGRVGQIVREYDYTLIHYHGKPAADGPRYKAIGNSMAVPCMEWIGMRIEKVEAQCH